MKVPKIICLTGFKESGKNAVADIITRLYGHEQIAFADPLKEKLASLVSGECKIPDDMPADIRGWIDVGRQALDKFIQDRGTDASEVGMLRSFYADAVVRQKPYEEWQRKGLQLLGTEYYRGKDSFYWVKSMHLSPDVNYVIADGRFHNEVEIAMALGGAVVRIFRPETDPKEYDDLHASEKHVPDLFWHVCISNNVDGLDNLEKEVIGAMVGLGEFSDFDDCLPVVNV